MTTKWPQDTAVLVPAYHARQFLSSLLPRIMDHVPAGQIVVVDDASGDGTCALCEMAGITCLRHETNRGKGAALATGFDYLLQKNFSFIITMDADGQHDPADLGAFVAAKSASSTPGLCIGCRNMKFGVMPPARILSNRLTSFILGLLCGRRILDSQCGYRLYAARLLKKIRIGFDRFEMESEVIMKAAFLGFPIMFTPVQTLYLKGPSNISHVADTLRWTGAVLRIRMQRNAVIRYARMHDVGTQV